MRLLILVTSVLAVSGCVGGPAPNFYNGRYYLAGDRNCRTMRAVSESRVNCWDKNGNLVGYRDAMTDQQLQMWQMQVQQINDTNRQLMQSAQATSERLRQQREQLINTQVQAVAPSGSPAPVTYTQVGQSLIGSNGVTYRRVGNSLIGSDGSSCQIVGQNIICR